MLEGFHVVNKVITNCMYLYIYIYMLNLKVSIIVVSLTHERIADQTNDMHIYINLASKRQLSTRVVRDKTILSLIHT